MGIRSIFSKVEGRSCTTNCTFNVYAFDNDHYISNTAGIAGSFGSSASGKHCSDFDSEFKTSLQNPGYVGTSVYSVDSDGKPYCAFTVVGSACATLNFIDDGSKEVFIAKDGNTINKVINSSTVAGNCTFNVYDYDTDYHVPTNSTTAGNYGNATTGDICPDFDTLFKSNFNNPAYIGVSTYISAGTRPYCSFSATGQSCNTLNFSNNSGGIGAYWS